MKKVFPLLLAVSLLVGMNTSALAVEETPPLVSQEAEGFVAPDPMLPSWALPVPQPEPLPEAFGKLVPVSPLPDGTPLIPTLLPTNGQLGASVSSESSDVVWYGDGVGTIG